MLIQSRTRTPNADVVVWNYNERLSSDNVTDIHGVEIVTLRESIISISTSKTKSSPAGRFDIRLAPTYNWLARLTEGSWLAILMSPDNEIENQEDASNRVANKATLKMLGRLEDIRLSAEVEPETGATISQYVLTGSDWGCVFENKLYIDPIARARNFDPKNGKFTAVGAAARLAYDKQLLEWIDKNNGSLPNSTTNCKGIINVWGAPLDFASISSVEAESGTILTGGGQFKFPQDFVRFISNSGNNITARLNQQQQVAKIIEVVPGRLIKQDTPNTSYKESYKDTLEASGFIDPASIFGEHTVWQLLTDNCNASMNELIADLRFENDNLKLALYKRIKPFVMREKYEGSSEVEDVVSFYKNVRRIDIATNDVININAGKTWKNRINFVEIRMNQQLIPGNQDAQIKSESQTGDRKSFERDGFMPQFTNSNYLPIDKNTKELQAHDLTKWKYLLREWYFNQHAQLNGAITFIGQNKYIQVGDNIVLDSKILGVNKNMSKAEQDRGGDTTLFMAHVEGVNHSFRVDGSGAKSFITTVQFVRGVLVRPDGTLILASDGSQLTTINDKKSASQTTNDEKNNQVVFPEV